MQYEKNVYLCDDVASPFVLGILQPKIFVPSGMTDEQLRYVQMHENVHIRRLDHVWKPLGFLLLAIYWFNPLLWLAYSLLSRDIERACDEKVVGELDGAGKKAYLQTLVECSMQRRMVMLCPVAFGEVGVKDRVKRILRYKKPGYWIMMISAVVCLVATVCLLTNPKVCAHHYESAVTTSPTCTHTGIETHTCQLCQHSYTTCAQLLAHSYNEGVVIEQASCTREGKVEYTCTGCGAKKTEQVGKLPHTAGEPVVVQEANCTEEGWISATCTVCRTVFVTEILQTNDLHDLVETVVTPATCESQGEGVLSCTRCAYTEHCTYEKLAHDWLDGQIRLSTCAKLGAKQQTCTLCGKERWVDIPKTNDHVWMDWGLYSPDKCVYCHISNPDDHDYIKRDYDLLAPRPYEGTLPVIRIWP